MGSVSVLFKKKATHSFLPSFIPKAHKSKMSRKKMILTAFCEKNEIK